MEPEEVLRCLETLHLTPEELMPLRVNELAIVQTFVGQVVCQAKTVSDQSNPRLSSSASL